MNRWIQILFVVLFAPAFLVAYEKPPYGPGQVRVGTDQMKEQEFEQIRIEEKLGEKVPLDQFRLRAEDGSDLLLQDLFRGKPVVISMIYFNCPSLCGLLMNGIVEALKRITFDIGTEYDVLFVSINPKETPELASKKRDNYIRDYISTEKNRDSVRRGWRFLTGEDEQLKALGRALGFGYRLDEKTGEYNHSAGFFVLTAEGVISRVHFGVQFEPRDVQLSIVEAGQGRVGSIVDKIMLFCYRYDPNAKGYALAAMNLMRVGGAITLLILVLYMGFFWARQRRLAKQAGRP